MGAVNQVLLAINAIEKHQLKINAVVLNSTKQKTHNDLSDNAAEIKALIAYPVFSVAYNQVISTDFINRIVT